jgi:hypothetical protein
VRRRWACPPEGGATATRKSTLLHSETLCPEFVKEAHGHKISNDIGKSGG